MLSPQWYLVVVGVQAISFGFPLALGFGVTRRDFYLGTASLLVLISAFNALAFAALTQLEQVTEGWWVDTYMFNALWLGIDGFWVDLFSFFVMQLLVFWSSLALAIVGTVSVITFTSSRRRSPRDLERRASRASSPGCWCRPRSRASADSWPCAGPPQRTRGYDGRRSSAMEFPPSTTNTCPVT